MKSLLSLLIIIISVFALSCKKKNQQEKTDVTEYYITDSAYTVRYAKGYTVKLHNGYKEVTVRNPWDTTKVLQKYILIDRSRTMPQNLPEGTIVRVPLTNLVAYSTIHCSILNELQLLNTIKGVCEPQYIDIPYIQEGISNGSIVDLGQASNPIIEKIIDLDPDAILATPINGQSYGNIIKVGIPIIETPDYMEETPLGRAEWVRFYSLFFNKEQYADSIFDTTVRNYNTVKEKVSTVSSYPTVFIDLMYRGVWYTSGGESFISKMLRDAGATYIWHANGQTAARPLSFEQVLNDAGEADFWLIKYNQPQDLTYSRLEKEYKAYSYFKAFKNKNIFECNTKIKNYYEDLPIHPDYILHDFAYIFHPELFPNYTPRYYSKMID